MLDEQAENGKGLDQKAKFIEEDLDRRILDLQSLINDSVEAGDLMTLADQLIKQTKVDAETIEDMINLTKKKIQYLKGTLGEMKKASEPDRDADYWDERDEIKQNIDQLMQIEVNIEHLVKRFEMCKADGLNSAEEVQKA